MSRNSVIIDSKVVDETLNNLSDDETRRNIIFKAVYAGAKELQRHTQYYFKAAMGESANHISKWIRKPMYEGITVKGDKAYMEARVSIMKDFRLKFFESGTKERYIKQKGHSDYSRKKKRYIKDTGKSNYRGSIKAKHFFAEARENMSYILEGTILESINKQILKLLNR